jgi:hypothetical protein
LGREWQEITALQTPGVDRHAREDGAPNRSPVRAAGAGFHFAAVSSDIINAIQSKTLLDLVRCIRA